PAGEWVDPSMVEDPAEFYYAGDSVGWNEMELIAQRMSVIAYLNGKKITDFNGEGIFNDELHKKFNVGEKGYICFQIHTGDQLKIRYKDIYIKKLD
ncbi:MAG: family 16 glycoside hydrolase, partial [Bacteroidales bacterium]